MPVQLIPEPEKPKPRQRKIAACAAAITLAGIIAGAAYFGSFSISKEQQTHTIDQSIKNAWKNRYDPEGIRITDDLLLQYAVFRKRQELGDNGNLPEEEARELDAIMFTHVKPEQERFLQEATPENYTDKVFYSFFLSSAKAEYLLNNPGNIADLFDLTNNPLFLDLLDEQRQIRDDNNLGKLILHAAVLLTHQRLEPSTSMSDSFPQFMENLQQGRGDCTDYTFAAANLYYAICSLIGRKDLAPKIRIAVGAIIDSDWSVLMGEGHCWMQYDDNGTWINYEMNRCDKIKKNTPVSLRSTPALYEFKDANGCYTLTFFTARAEYHGENGTSCLSAHILPDKE